MSSKLTIKQSKKERPRSSDKIKNRKRDGTPEKQTTPNASQDALLEEGQQAEKQVIMNDEIRALQIKTEELSKLREPQPPSDSRKSPPASSVVVRKLRPASELNKPRPKLVTVAKPAPPDAPVKPISYTGEAGLRFDAEGSIVPHSILGSVEDYTKQALARGELPDELRSTAGSVCGELTVKYEKKKPSKSYPQFESTEESNALKNWQKKMLERRNQQGYLSKLLNKPVEQLVMNQADSYRQTQELRYIIDRTIPTMDYGKGYRIGSEFWKQRERIGDDLTGVHMTMSQTEKGYPPPIEHVGVPDAIEKEKGRNVEKPPTPFHKPWHKSSYLQQRREQLQPVINELDPHNPALGKLEVVGYNQENMPVVDPHTTPLHEAQPELYSEGERKELVQQASRLLTAEKDSQFGEEDPLADHPDVHPEPVFGPSIKFAGQNARWTGDSASFAGQLGLEARVCFETFSGKRITSYLEIENDGTTCIYYDWKKVPKTNPFEMVNAKVQRFYFNTSSGVILPGDTMKFPFVFKSPNAGVFSEQWQLETHPVVCGGAALVVTLRGVALQEDKFEQQRTELEQELAHKQAEQVVGGVLQDILEGIRTPERARSPVDFYITEEELFSRKNPHLHYSSETVSQMKELHHSLFPEKPPEEPEEGAEPVEQPPEVPEWDLCVDTLKQMMMEISEEEQEQEQQAKLQQLNLAILSLAFPPFGPAQQRMYNVGYRLMCETAGKIVSESVTLRSALGIPDMEADVVPDELPKTGGSDRRQSSMTKGDSRRGSSTPTSHGSDSHPSEGKRGATQGGGKGKPDPKDKKGGKDSKTSPTKSSAKDSKGGGKITPAGKRPNTREKDRVATPPSGYQSPVIGGDPILSAKYKEKLHAQAHSLVSDMIDQMETMFQSIQEEEGGPKLPVL